MAQQRILIVDDDPAARQVIAGLLQMHGFETAEAAHGMAALMRLESDGAFALVLADLMMPLMDGLTLLNRIRVDFPGTPVVPLTAVTDTQVVINLFRHGAVDYLVKPFAEQELIDVVERALEQGERRRQCEAYQQNLQQMVTLRTERLRATMIDLERSYDTTLEAMGDALDLRDAETEGHSRRVTAYTIALAREIGIDDDQLRILARGAFLHDIGKIATPDAILLKPGRLDDGEMAIMREHCARGYEMVRKIPFLREASEIVYAHQERFDGTGYPRGLRGKEIPLGARIFAIADTLDAITSDRAYRQGRSLADARAEIERGAGTQFDPEIVAVYLSIPEDHWRSLRTAVSQMPSAGVASLALAS